MKIILSYVSAGAGHLKAAEAVFLYLQKHYPEHNVVMFDVLDFSTRFFKDSYLGGYNLLINRSTFLWRIAFYFTKFKCLRFLTRPVAIFLNAINTKGFANLLVEENPDVIISTHFLSSEIAARLKFRKIIKAKVYTIITDFGVHPFWITKGTDFYIVASDITKQILISEGISANQAKVLGIPIDEKFLISFDKDSIKSNLGLNKERFTVLIMTGSFGIGPIREIVELFKDSDVQLLVVCAKNKSLFSDLSKKQYENLKLYAFVDNVQELMSVSDLIVTKPGGLSSSELLAMKLPAVFISAIPGQESVNQELLSKLGAGIIAKSAEEVKNIVLRLKNNNKELTGMKDQIELIAKPNATKEISDAICSGSI